MTYEANLKECRDKAVELFSSKFGGKPDIAVSAPGRVNLIGEHTDYNDGFVLPMALPLMTVIVGRKSKSTGCIIVSTSRPDTESCQEFQVPPHPGDSPDDVSTDGPTWIKYVKGVVALINKNGDIPGFEAVITSCVPLGGGVSSSASLEVAVGLFVEQLLGKELPNRVDLALICQQAEHRYAGNKCGIMDQFVSLMAKEGHALLIDCKNYSQEHIPFNNPDLAVLVTDTGVRHELVEGHYNARRESCISAATKLGLSPNKLRSATMEQLNEVGKKLLSEEEMKRAHHVISEIARTKAAVNALHEGDYVSFGKLMNESHNSLRDDYEVSCKELDELVDITRQDSRVYGSRMTGGGFGGCTVTLLPKDAVEHVKGMITEQYSGTPTFYVSSASPGAGVLSLD